MKDIINNIDTDNEMEKAIFEVEFDETCDEYDWKYFTDSVSEMMNGISEDNDEWHIEGRKMGWRNLNGYANVIAENGQELLDVILADDNCSCKASQYKKRIEFAIYNHDSPTGEFFTVTKK